MATSEPAESARARAPATARSQRVSPSGVRERIDETRTCALGYCEDGNPTDPWGGDGCADSPEIKMVVHLRDATGAFAAAP